ncbi:hypothetical protein LCGC14_0219730 [marine sediment metagenome]|uniref:Uncharacterized protein n=1 Tax=marine sediment metagenome TaxID=412755 RepID=A0A0F9XGR5_9ZZZZ
MSNDICLTKEYARDGFVPTDLQWQIDKIAEDFTLYDLFRLVYQADIIVPGICATLGMPEFTAFWDQINLERDPDDEKDLEYLELYWRCDYDTRVVKKGGKPTDQKNHGDILDNDKNYWDDPKIGEMSNLMGFHGIGPLCPLAHTCSHECGDDCKKEDSGYAIEFTSVNNLQHLPIRVSPKVSFHPPFVESDRDFHRTGFELTIQPTLWCFITSIFWELTFVGYTPDEVADKSQEFHDRVDEAKDHMKKLIEDNPNDD